MNKEFVPYEQALALKELGFDEPCFGYYDGGGNLYTEMVEVLKAPLYQQAFRWFREKYQLHSFIYEDNSWNISGGIWDLNGYIGSRYDWDSDAFNTYEEAEQACLDKLIEIVKTNETLH